MWGYATFLLCLAVIAFGKKVEKTLEYAEWFMVAWILIFLLIIGAFIAGFNFVILGIHLLVVQRRFLPAELRMPRRREYALYGFVLMFAFFTLIGIQSKWADIMKAVGRS